MKPFAFALLLLTAFFSWGFSSVSFVGSDGSKVLVVVKNLAGEENYSKVHILRYAGARLKSKGVDQSFSQNVPVSVVEDIDERLERGFYVVVAASDDNMVNKFILVK